MANLVSAHHALLFLLGHSTQDAESAGIILLLAKHMNGSTGEAIHDHTASITVDVDKQQVIVVVQTATGERVFISNPPYKYTTTDNRDYLPQSVKGKPGIFYTRNQDPRTWNNNDIFIQQFPMYLQEGRQRAFPSSRRAG